MKLNELWNQVASRCGLMDDDEVEEVVRALSSVIVEAVSRGERVSVPGLGVFRARARAGRTWDSPTGGHHAIPARSVLTFRAAESVRVLGGDR